MTEEVRPIAEKDAPECSHSWTQIDGKAVCRYCAETMPHAAQRVTTVRMTEEQAVEVELVARVLGISVSELIRTAIAEYLTKRKGEVEFRQRLAQRIEKDRHILDRLADECTCHRGTVANIVCPVHVLPPGAGRDS